MTNEGFETSGVVMLAIGVVAGEDYNPPEDDESVAIEEYNRSSAFFRVWAQPTEEEAREVARLAWSYAEPEEDVLFWGQEMLRRKIDP